MTMRLTQVRDFVMVVESGSIGAAARQLGVSQPGITKSIRTLETELHVKLLQRTTRGIVPTEYGRTFFARAQVAQAELRKAHQEIQQLLGERLGSVAFGVGPLVASQLVPEAVGRFRKQFPQAELRVVEGLSHTLVPLVQSEALDFAVVVRVPRIRLGAAITFRPLFVTHRIVVARKGHPLANARSLAQLADAPWGNFEPRAVLEHTFSTVGLRAPAPIILCESYNAFVAMVARTDMLAIVPRSVLRDSFDGDRLLQISITEEMPSFTVGVFTRADTPLTPAAAAMAKAISAVGRAYSSSR